MTGRMPIGPVIGRIADLRKTFSIAELADATGVSRHNLCAFLTPGRLTVPADQGQAILDFDPSDYGLKISDLVRFTPQKFKEVREAKGYSQAALEAAAGFSSGYIHHWESGRNVPRVARLNAAMRVLGCVFDDVSGSPSLRFEPEPSSVTLRPQDDMILTPYPCHVCGQGFRSRRMLATHRHPRKESA